MSFQSTNGRVQHAVRHLRGQLDKAVSRIKTLEAELKHGRSKATEINRSEDWAPVSAPLVLSHAPPLTAVC